MVKNWITSASSTWLLLGALGLLVTATGCGGSPASGIGGESVGAAALADSSSIFVSYGISQHHFKGTLKHNDHNNGMFGLKYGMKGGSSKTTYTYDTNVDFDGFIPGASYDFTGTDCGSAPWGYGGSCDPWSAPMSLYSPADGTLWSACADGCTDLIGSAYQAGTYYGADGSLASVPLCAGAYGDGTYLGYYQDGGCNIGVGGAVYSVQDPYLLMDPGQGSAFTPISQGAVPYGVQAGYANGAGLYACLGSLDGASVPGWWGGDGCNVAGLDGSFHNVQDCSLLTLNAQSSPAPGLYPWDIPPSPVYP